MRANLPAGFASDIVGSRIGDGNGFCRFGYMQVLRRLYADVSYGICLIPAINSSGRSSTLQAAVRSTVEIVCGFLCSLFPLCFLYFRLGRAMW